MSTPVRNFLSARWELARLLARHDRPLTFVLGAGASLSSGGPLTRTVHERLAQATQVRLGDLVRERLHDIVSDEVRDHLRDLFDGINPNIGYRLLAALGRTRRICVVNLNWDDAVERACALARVPFAPFDPLSGRTLDDAVAELPETHGVVIVHVHGTMTDRPRYSFLETLPNHREIWRAVRPLLSHSTIVCGASLAGDLDVADVLLRQAPRATDGPPVWVFARGEALKRQVALPPTWTEVTSDDTDFDELMCALSEEIWASQGLADARWNDILARVGHLRLPTSDRLVEFDNELRHSLLDARVAALVGRPQAGKTVSALRLAHLRLLMEAPRAQLHISVDMQDSVTALGIAANRHDIVLFVDDPFGPNEPAQNPRVVDFLRALADSDGSYAYVASRNANWEQGAGRLQREYAGLAVPTRHTERWYEPKALFRLADTTQHPAKARRLIHKKAATTPADVIEAGDRGRVLDNDERLADGHRMLEAHPELALCCVLVRLQEFRASPIPNAELAAVLGIDPDEIHGGDALLNSYVIDGKVCWAFAHPTSRHITDAYLGDHLDRVRKRIFAAPVVPSWAPRVIDGWRLQQGLLAPDECAIGTEELAPGDWIAEHLGATPSPALLHDVARLGLDQWSTIELAYELVRVWDNVRELNAADDLLEALLGRPMGAYAILEGCLYFQLGAEDELWSRVSGRLWSLSRKSSRRFETILALDAMLWRPPDDDAVKKWAAHELDNLDPTTAEFAFVRFAAGYHPDGLALLDASRALERDRHLEWNPEQAETAARLVAWHFGHQSRARAMLHRYTHHDKQWLCQSAFTGGPQPASEPALNLAHSLAAEHNSSGWAFHLLCNLSAVTGLDLSNPRVAQIAEQALDRAPPGDPGVVSAVLAYAPADCFRKVLRRRADRLAERDAYREALASGVACGRDLHIGPPRFRYIHDPASVITTMELRLPNLDPRIAALGPTELGERLWAAAARVMAESSLDERRDVARMIGRVERGDLEPLAEAARGLHERDPFETVIDFWRRRVPSDRDGKLFL